MKKRHILRLTSVLALGLGLTLALLWVLDGGTTPVTAAPASRPLQGPGDVYCVTPVSQTYAGCTKVFTSVQFAVDAATGGEIVKVAAGTYTDIHYRSFYTQVVRINIPITIRGGYTTTNNFAGPPDPDTYPTTLDAGGQGRVVYIMAVTATLEGLRLTNGSTVGSIGERGGGIYAYGPHLVISGCHIFSNTAPENAGSGGGLWIESPAATLMNNQVYSNTARSGGGVYLNSADAALTKNRIHSNRTTQFGGGGLQVSNSPGARLTDNEVYSNTSQMGGGGIYIYSSSDGVTLTGNNIYSNTAQNTGGGISVGGDNATLVGNQIYANTTSSSGGGIYLTLCENPTLTNNEIYSNTASGFGGGINLNQAENATLTGNQVYSNTAGSSGGGICFSQSPTGTLTSNQVYSNTAGVYGGGIYLSQSPTGTLTGNQVYSNTAGADGGGICLTHNDNTTLVNNVVTENRIVGGGKGPGIHILQSSEVRLLHTTVARNTGGDGVGVGLYWGGGGIPTLATLTNTILVSHTVGITVEQWCTATLAGTLWGEGEWANESPALVNGTIISSNNVTGDPSFVNPGGGDYHITGASAGRDVAVSTVVTDDIDGDSRPFGAGPDIGADEAQCHVRVGGTYYRSVQAAVDASVSSSDVVQVAGTCQGVETRASYDQVVYISKTLTVRGGYSPDFSVWDPLTYPTTLDAEEQGHVIVVNGTMPGSITPTLETLRIINGQDAQGGAGVYSRFADTVISGCQIYSNTATQNQGGGIYIAYGPNARLIGNNIHNNAAEWPMSSKGGGIYLGSCGSAMLTDNVIANNTAPEGGGVYLYYSDATCANNIVADNEASDMGSGLYILNCSPRLLHNTIARNTDGEGSGIYVTRSGGSAYSSVALTNTILAGNTTGITVTGGNTATLEATLWGDGDWANDLNWGGGGVLISSTNVTGDPAFVDPDGGDYHIHSASAALDKGISTWVSTDIDGDPRAIGAAPDLGADEIVMILGLSKQGPSWVNEGDPINYSLGVQNTGVVTAYDVVLSDTLPYGAFFVFAGQGGSESDGEVSWPPFDVAPGGQVTRTFTVTATESITNDDYMLSAQGVSGVKGTVVVATCVNHSPTANAEAIPNTLHTGTVTLDGSGSSDPDGDALSYQWAQTGGPAAVSLAGAGAMTATFTAPLFDGVYTFTLAVSDTYGLVDSDATTVTVTNDPPVADAGASQAVTSGVVTLDGSGTHDDDDDPLTYLWQQTGGPMIVSLTNADTATATFTAPPFGGVYSFTLAVSDTFGAADADDTEVTVTLPVIAIAKSGPDEVEVGEPITYTLIVTNSGTLAASSLVITDALPTGASFIAASDGGLLVGDVVSWTATSLGTMERLTRTFTVTATETITNSDYCASCGEGIGAVGTVSVVTEVSSERKIYLPLVLRGFQ